MRALQLTVALVCMSGTALAGTDNPYPKMADAKQYRAASKADEIALARSAAPPAIADHAAVLVLGDKGYETAVAGSNGFTCFVGRSWDVGFADPQFWNPRIRSPQCMNAASVRSVLPRYLTRTEWVLAGVSKDDIKKREATARAAGKLTAPDAESMCYMMSKDGYLNDDVTHWHPHVMFFTPRGDLARWGANQQGSPVMADDKSYDDADIFFVVVANWSDGTSAQMQMH
jgi:hypothetical protein|nr:hypothetical protein [Kofleriaceae bacterium]